jgi:sulfonate transport system substrate-binding protein
MIFTRRDLVASIGAGALGLAIPAIVRAQTTRPKLIVGTQDIGIQETVNASGALEGAAFDLQWAVLPGPAAQLSGLYSRALDVGLMGDTSLIIEQGHARTDWTSENAPLQIVAGWRNPDRGYPPIVTAVRTDANINSLADLRGRKWSYNFGGFNYLQYVLSRNKAGLKETDIEPVKLVDTNASAAAFNSGRTAVYSGGVGPIKESLDKGSARILLYSDELDIPSLNVFTARGEVVRDEAKSAALFDFLSRVREHWDWHRDNRAAVERIYQEKLKQSPEKAKFYAADSYSAFYALDDDLVHREQKIADLLYSTGDIQKKIDVNVEFARRFNGATVRSS